MCDPTLLRVSQGSFPDNTTDLNNMCNSACTDSLDALRTVQIANCTNDNITVGYEVYPATYITDMLLYTYSYACLTDS